MSSECVLLEQDDTIPTPPLCAAPWKLRGSGYVVLLRAPELSDEQLFVPPSLLGKRRGSTLSLLFFDFQSSDCGPYRELTIAGTFAFAEGEYSSITRAYASTYDSVLNTRFNWGVPEDRADFKVENLSSKRDRIAVSRDGHVFAELELEHYGLSIPVTTSLLPADLRTMVQHRRGRQYSLTLNAKGKARMAKLVHSRFDASYFPEVSQASVLACGYMPNLELLFPAAQVRTLQTD